MKHLSREEIERKNFIRFRKERGLTQAQIAKRIGSSKSMMSQVETGFRGLGPNIERRLIKAYDLDQNYFVKPIEDPASTIRGNRENERLKREIVKLRAQIEILEGLILKLRPR